MTPYILADHPNVTAKEALKISMRMTKGYRGDIFVMILVFLDGCFSVALPLDSLVSFIPTLTCTSSLAGLYEEIKDHALEVGTVHASELA